MIHDEDKWFRAELASELQSFDVFDDLANLGQFLPGNDDPLVPILDHHAHAIEHERRRTILSALPIDADQDKASGGGSRSNGYGGAGALEKQPGKGSERDAHNHRHDGSDGADSRGGRNKAPECFRVTWLVHIQIGSGSLNQGPDTKDLT